MMRWTVWMISLAGALAVWGAGASEREPRAPPTR